MSSKKRNSSAETIDINSVLAAYRDIKDLRNFSAEIKEINSVLAAYREIKDLRNFSLPETIDINSVFTAYRDTIALRNYYPSKAKTNATENANSSREAPVITYPDWEPISRMRFENEEEKRKAAAADYERWLFPALNQAIFEDGEISAAERIIIDITEKHSFQVLETVIQNIYIKYNDYVNVLVNTCKCLERFEYSEVRPWGPIMLVALTRHKSDTVKEAALVLIENWAPVEMLPVLRNMECSKNWMKAYLKEIIRFLEEREDVLRTKAV